MKTFPKVRIRFYSAGGVANNYACGKCGHSVARGGDACACGAKLGPADSALELSDLVRMLWRMRPRYRRFKRLLCRCFPKSMTQWTDDITEAMWAFEKAAGLYKEGR